MLNNSEEIIKQIVSREDLQKMREERKKAIIMCENERFLNESYCKFSEYIIDNSNNNVFIKIRNVKHTETIEYVANIFKRKGYFTYTFSEGRMMFGDDYLVISTKKIENKKRGFVKNWIYEKLIPEEKDVGRFIEI